MKRVEGVQEYQNPAKSPHAIRITKRSMVAAQFSAALTLPMPVSCVISMAGIGSTSSESMISEM